MADENNGLQPDEVSPEAETVQNIPLEKNFHSADTLPNMPRLDMRPFVWPPTQDYRVRRRVPNVATLLLALLALALIGSGLGFIVYATSRDYHQSLVAGATAEMRSTQNAQATVQAFNQATADIESTMQAQVGATATAQDNANATATATIDSATATVNALSVLFTQSTSGTPVFDDPLSDANGAGKWDEGNDPSSVHTGCVFSNGGYHVMEAQQGYFRPCIAQATDFNNFAYQVSMTVHKGNRAQGGILFRATPSNDTFYFFRIGTDGSYALDVYKGNNQVSTLTSGQGTAINPGVGQSNQIAAIVNSNQLTLYVNGQYVDSVTDGNLTEGKIGVAVINVNSPVDASFSDAQVWKL